ncbi:ChaN family lipoprotein [Acaryochloris sp. IP29b_bin.137]|uniref:ChaN family lipoprotein n=1 Tax=Acaryochloris sp. IP29b_bin.137 TaxID=2969217 RepID=UPI0026120E6E|nr:ChaN family lipoprotein [Acaryochloris sp. IP29b_bin.137]
MRQPRPSTLWSLGLGLLLICALPTVSWQWIRATSAVHVEQKALLDQLAKAQVVYLGETHDSKLDHNAQLTILRELYQRQPQLAIAMEMFQRPFQQPINRYLAGEITEAQLQKLTEYHQRWGFDWEFYAPVLRFAKQHQLPVIALNTPTEVTKKVSKKGLDSLKPEELTFIPPVNEIDVSNTAYRQKLEQIYEKFHPGHASESGFERFFTAQVLWDETMAEKIAQTVSKNMDQLVIVLAGKGHIEQGYGIPDRVARRLTTHKGLGQTFRQYTVYLNPTDEVQQLTNPPAADFYWTTP